MHEMNTNKVSPLKSNLNNLKIPSKMITKKIMKHLIKCRMKLLHRKKRVKQSMYTWTTKKNPTHEQPPVQAPEDAPQLLPQPRPVLQPPEFNHNRPGVCHLASDGADGPCHRLRPRMGGYCSYAIVERHPRVPD